LPSVRNIASAASRNASIVSWTSRAGITPPPCVSTLSRICPRMTPNIPKTCASCAVAIGGRRTARVVAFSSARERTRNQVLGLRGRLQIRCASFRRRPHGTSSCIAAAASHCRSASCDTQPFHAPNHRDAVLPNIACHLILITRVLEWDRGDVEKEWAGAWLLDCESRAMRDRRQVEVS
jgi:hypothetical protein